MRRLIASFSRRWRFNWGQSKGIISIICERSRPRTLDLFHLTLGLVRRYSTFLILNYTTGRDWSGPELFQWIGFKDSTPPCSTHLSKHLGLAIVRILVKSWLVRSYYILAMSWKSPGAGQDLYPPEAFHYTAKRQGSPWDRSWLGRTNAWKKC